MDKSAHLDASDLAEMIIKELSAQKVDEEDSYILEGMNLGLTTAINKVREICKREDVPLLSELLQR